MQHLLNTWSMACIVLEESLQSVLVDGCDFWSGAPLLLYSLTVHAPSFALRWNYSVFK